jgi:hypothetical protein
MSKVSLEEVESKMLELKIDPTKVQQVVTELEKVVEEIAEERKAEAGPKQKWDYVIVLNDKDGILKDKEIAGWVVQKPEEDDAGLVLSKLSDSAKVQNENTKKKANKITDLVSLFEHIKPKFTKENKVRVKTKELTRVIITNGNL